MAEENTFTSLNFFFEIIANEEDFKIQIITLETIETFELALTKKNIFYIKNFTSTFKPTENGINLLILDKSIKFSKKGKYILYSNKRQEDFIQIIFNPTLEEKKLFVQDNFLLKSYGYKSISELQAIENQRMINISEFYKNCLDYHESAIIFAMINASKFNDILTAVSEINSKFGNSFILQTKLNGLVQKQFVSKNGSNYTLSISSDAVKTIVKTIEFNVNAYK